MVFIKNDPKTLSAAKRGGSTGKKNFQTLPKDKLRAISADAGKRSGEARRKKIAKQAEVIEDRIMHDYLD